MRLIRAVREWVKDPSEKSLAKIRDIFDSQNKPMLGMGITASYSVTMGAVAFSAPSTMLAIGAAGGMVSGLLALAEMPYLGFAFFRGKITWKELVRRSCRSIVKSATETAGFVGGAWGGFHIGTVYGKAYGPYSNVVCGIVGGIIGAMVGYMAAGLTAEQIFEKVWAKEEIHETNVCICLRVVYIVYESIIKM